jgi:hypothetical protein
LYYNSYDMLNVRLDKELDQKLRKYADLTNQTKSDVVKEALLDYLNKHQLEKSPFDLGEDLFGVEGAADRDLSTAYKSKLKDKLGKKYPH